MLMNSDGDASASASGTATEADPYSGRSGRQTMLLVVLTLAAMLGALDRQIMQLLLLPIKSDLGLTDTQVSQLYGLAFSLSNVLFLLPAGLMADRVNRRRLLVAGIAAWSLLTGACGFALSYASMFAARAGVGIGESVIQPTGVSMLRSAIPPERRGRAFAIYAMAIMLGTALALLGGGLLLGLIGRGLLVGVPLLGDLHPWQAVLLILGTLGLPIMLLVSLVSEPGRPSELKGASYSDALRFIAGRKGVFFPLAIFNTAAGMLTLGFAAWVVPVLVRRWGLTIPEVGTRLGVMMLVLPPLGLFATGWLIDMTKRRFGLSGPMLLGAILLLANIVVHVFAPIYPTLAGTWVLLALIMLLGTTCIPIANTMVAAIAPANLIGRISSLQYMLYGVFGGGLSATAIAMVSDGFFTGPAAIAHALSIMCGVYGSIGAIGALATAWQLRPPSSS
nr:MFS transporter [Sphingomonas populi]